MLRIFSTLPLACLAALLAACSGGGTTHEVSQQGDDFCRIVSDVQEAGSPCVIRCRAEADPSVIEIESWSWGASNGRIVHQNDDGSEVWVAMDRPGACTLSARGVDKDGRDCTTPRHKLMSSKKSNAAPVIECGDPTDSPFERPSGDGSVLRYHQWRWSCVCYDPDDPNAATGSELEISRTGDLDGDGVPDVVVAMNTEGQSTISSDLDGDGEDEDCNGNGERTFPGVHVFELRCPSKAKEDVYVWKIKSSAGSSRKEFKGHVTLMK